RTTWLRAVARRWAAGSPATASSRASAWRTTAPGASVPTSAPIPAPRRIACGSPARRRPTSPPSSACSATLPAPLGAPDDEPFADVTDEDGTRHRLWRVAADPAVADTLADAELLIADGHHRYETARVYAEEIGGEGAHRYVLACLVSLEDPGLTVFPTHRLLTELKDERRQLALRDALLRDWEVERIELDDLEPAPDGQSVQLGYVDSFHQQGFRLTLKDGVERPAGPLGGLDTAVLEQLLLKGPLEMSDDDISHFNGLDYSRSFAEAKQRILDKDVDAAFFTGAVPVTQIRDIAAAGEVMPPKSTYFFPKVLTGLLFHPLDEE
ncbi:MAG: hypothetical protein QOI80_1786, partial [Solirubrobacteraceae bacterium]|nr:hypothetical protein [Solirubrobacteraceae bacterium]